MAYRNDDKYTRNHLDKYQRADQSKGFSRKNTPERFTRAESLRENSRVQKNPMPVANNSASGGFNAANKPTSKPSQISVHENIPNRSQVSQKSSGIRVQRIEESHSSRSQALSNRRNADFTGTTRNSTALSGSYVQPNKISVYANAPLRRGASNSGSFRGGESKDDTVVGSFRGNPDAVLNSDTKASFRGGEESIGEAGHFANRTSTAEGKVGHFRGNPEEITNKKTGSKAKNVTGVSSPGNGKLSNEINKAKKKAKNGEKGNETESTPAVKSTGYTVATSDTIIRGARKIGRGTDNIYDYAYKRSKQRNFLEKENASAYKRLHDKAINDINTTKQIYGFRGGNKIAVSSEKGSAAELSKQLNTRNKILDSTYSRYKKGQGPEFKSGKAVNTRKTNTRKKTAKKSSRKGGIKGGLKGMAASFVLGKLDKLSAKIMHQNTEDSSSIANFVNGLIKLAMGAIVGLLGIALICTLLIGGVVAVITQVTPIHLFISTEDNSKESMYDLCDELMNYYIEFNQEIYDKTNVNTQIYYTNQASNFLDVLEVYSAKIPEGDDPCKMTAKHKKLLKEVFEQMNKYTINNDYNYRIGDGDILGEFSIGTLWDTSKMVQDGFFRSVMVSPNYQYLIPVGSYLQINGEKFHVTCVGNTGNCAMAVLHPDYEDFFRELKWNPYLEETYYDEPYVFDGSLEYPYLLFGSVEYHYSSCVVTSLTKEDYKAIYTLTKDQEFWLDTLQDKSLLDMCPDLQNYIDACRYAGRIPGKDVGSSDELWLLYQCAFDEARGEGTIGIRAVTEVILNRVASPLFPNSVKGVISAPHQFSGYHGGYSNVPSSEVVEAVNSVLRSDYEFMLPSNALFFNSGSSCANGTPYVRINHHIFATRGASLEDGYIKYKTNIDGWSWY